MVHINGSHSSLPLWHFLEAAIVEANKKTLCDRSFNESSF